MSSPSGGASLAPTVSVVIPSYNSAHLLPRALASVLAQTRAADEILVVDDGSLDDTAAVLARYSGRVRALTQTNSGSAAARNHGVLEARGKWIAFLDADDAWRPEKLEKQLALMAARAEAGLIYTDALVAGPDGEQLGYYLADKGPVDGWAFERLLSSFFVLPSTVLVRRELLLQAGLFLTTMRRAEDYDLWLRLAKLTPFALLPEPLVIYERQPGSLTRNQAADHEAHVELFARLLESDLAPAHRATLARRLRASRYSLAWELRRGDRVAALRAAWSALASYPGDPAAWKLALGSLVARRG